MSKDPAFLFYSSDFLTGTTFMTMEERGQYITILCLLHQHGGCVPLDKLEIAVGKLSTPTLEKLSKNQHGYFNDRLTQEIKKRQEYSKSRSNNRLGKVKRKKICKSYVKSYVNSMSTHMENENENENIIKDKDKDKDNYKVFIESLKTNPAYDHINLDAELGKMDAWLSLHKGRQKTKRFVLNWLNKIEKPLPINKPKQLQPEYRAPNPKEKFKFVPELKGLLKDLAAKKSVK